MQQKSDISVFLVWCIWLLPLASIKVLSFGWPLYPIEALLLIVLPFFPFQEYRLLWRLPIVRTGAIFSATLLIGVISSYIVNTKTLVGLGQMKSFFFFPLLLALFLLPLLRDRENRKRLYWHMRFMMLMVATAAILTIFFDGISYDHRLHAWFQSPNLLALFLLPGTVMWWAQVALRTHTSWSDFISWGIVVGAFFLTRSYGAIFALVLSSGYLFMRYRGRATIKRGVYIAAAVVLIVFGVMENGTEKGEMLLSWNSRSSGESRVMIWRSAEKMIQDHPIAGIGPGRFQNVYLEYQRFYPPYLEWAVPHPHNFFLSLWLSAGALGAGAFLWLTAFLVRTIRQSASMNKEKTLILALLISFFAAGLFDVPYFRFEFCAFFWIYLTLFIAVYTEDHSVNTLQSSI